MGAKSRSARPTQIARRGRCGPPGPTGGPRLGQPAQPFLEQVEAGLQQCRLRRELRKHLLGTHDEWIAFPGRYLPEGGMDQIYPTEPRESAPALPNATDD